MESKTYTHLLGQLADALKHWGNLIPIDRYLDNKAIDDRFSDRTNKARLELCVKLAADRRSYLAELLDTALDQVKEQGKQFTVVCRKQWRGAQHVPELFDANYADGTYSLSFLNSVGRLFTELSNCDFLFKTIDDAIRQIDSPGSDDSNGYENRFKSEGYLAGEMRQMLGISQTTLNKYAKAASIDTPGKGRRDHRYSQVELKAICAHICVKVSDTKAVKKARDILAEIKSKSRE